MIRFLTLEEVLELHGLTLQQTGGLAGIRDFGGLESAVAQPHMTFDGHELYPSLAEKAAALGYSIVCNHPFLDGNKRVGHLAMETFLVLNGFELSAGTDEQERVILELAGGKLTRKQFTDWVRPQLRSCRAEG